MSSLSLPLLIRQVGFSFFRSIHYVEEPSFTPNPSTFEGPKAVPEGSGIDLESYVQAANKETDFHFFSVSDYYHAYRYGYTRTLFERRKRAILCLIAFLNTRGKNLHHVEGWTVI